MDNIPSASEEIVLKEYPRFTQWIKSKEIVGIGNLILTDRRLIFLHQLPLDEEDLDNLKKLSEKTSTSQMLDIARSLHKNNFQILLSSIVQVKTKLYSPFPFPRFCLRIDYTDQKKGTQNLTFMFTIPLLRGWFQLEITTVMSWAQVIRRALKGIN